MTQALHSIVPRRIFLDTCTFQAVADCGGFIFDAEELPRPSDYGHGQCPQVVARPDSQDILEALRWIFLFNERAHFNWIVSRGSVEEVDACGDRYRSSYIRDIADHSWTCLVDEPPTHAAVCVSEYINSPKCGFLSKKDKALLSEAAAAGCDTFLTIERRLPKVANNLLKNVPLMITTPTSLWSMLEPYVRSL